MASGGTAALWRRQMDKLDPTRRSANMRAIRGKDTRPELAVRRVLRKAGFPGYRLHRNDLPGRPDIVYAGRRKIVLVHGCFWHGHDCREGTRKPKSRTGYWNPKIEGNRARDLRNVELLAAAGWSIETVWECETGDPGLPARLIRFLEI